MLISFVNTTVLSWTNLGRSLYCDVFLVVLVIIFGLNGGDERRFCDCWSASIIRVSYHDRVIIRWLHRCRVELLLGILVYRGIIKQACGWLVWVIFFHRPSKFECLDVILWTIKANWWHCKVILNNFWLFDSLVDPVLGVRCHRWLVCRVVLLRDAVGLHELFNTTLFLFNSVNLGLAIGLGHVWLQIWKFLALTLAFWFLRVNILLDYTDFLKDTLVFEVLLFANVMGVVNFNFYFTFVNFVLYNFSLKKLFIFNQLSLPKFVIGNELLLHVAVLHYICAVITVFFNLAL